MKIDGNVNEYQAQLKKVNNIFANAIIRSSRDVFGIMHQFYEYDDKEKLYVMLLNSRKKVIGVNLVSIGTVDNVTIHPREVFKVPIILGAVSIILIHNHPSGDVRPSDSDIDMTKKIIECGKLLDIPLMDHIIYYENKHYSIYNEEEIDE